VLLKIVYLLTCRVLGVAVLVLRGDRAKAAELLVLRHENAVLRPHVSRVRYDPADRLWFAALARLLPRRRWTEVFPVTPATLLAWHRTVAAAKYGTSKRRKPGRPPTARSIAGLVVRLAKEAPRQRPARHPAEPATLRPPPHRHRRLTNALGSCLFSGGAGGGSEEESWLAAWVRGQCGLLAACGVASMGEIVTSWPGSRSPPRQ
jgi:hypothetical protein